MFQSSDVLLFQKSAAEVYWNGFLRIMCRSKELGTGRFWKKGSGLLFKNGEVVRKLKEEEIVDTLIAEIEAWQPSEDAKH